MKGLESQKLYRIEQVAATMAIENMQIDNQTIFPAYYADCMCMKDNTERFIRAFILHYVDLNTLHRSGMAVARESLPGNHVLDVVMNYHLVLDLDYMGIVLHGGCRKTMIRPRLRCQKPLF